MTYKSMKYKYVEVEWNDAQAESGWADDPDDLVRCVRCVTRGWLVKETQEEVVLAMALGIEDFPTVGGTWAIPRSMIHEVRSLRVTKDDN